MGLDGRGVVGTGYLVRMRDGGAAPRCVWGEDAVVQMNGYEVAHELRNDPRLRRAILIALTGYGTSEDGARVLQAGFDQHLTKPVDPDTLDSLIRSLVAT